MKCTSRLRFTFFVFLAIVCCTGVLGVVAPGNGAFGEEISLPSLQERIVAAAAKAKPSVVRVVWPHDGSDDGASGVILTADGYIATYLYKSHHVPQIADRYETHVPAGEAVSVCLFDGRRVPGVVIGSYSSVKHLSFDLVKITEEGVWPHAEIGRSDGIAPGTTCLALGVLGETGGADATGASVRVGHLIPWGVSGTLRSSCVIDSLDDRGGGLFDLEGRLVGIHLVQPFTDYETCLEPTACHLDIEVVQQNWRALAAKEPLTEGSGTADEEKEEALPRLDAPELAATVTGAREVTVALATREAPHGCSGTIVSADGYIATCAHHQLKRGARTAVTFADGRRASAVILGRDDILDIGLAKLTDPGPWPFAELGSTADVQVGDPCVIAGYPNYLRKNGKTPLVVRGARIADLQYAPTETLSQCQVWDGDSGGGLFDTQGRLVGVLSGPATPLDTVAHSGADGFARLRNMLVDGPALGDPVPFESSPVAQAMAKSIECKAPIVCQVLADGKSCALGTIVTPDGFVLTKASELYGPISCRLADGRELPATVRRSFSEHDLALLKIDAKDLSRIQWSLQDDVAVGALVAAPRFNRPPTVGVVSYPAREIPAAMGSLWFGKIEDAPGGIQVAEVYPWWKSVVEDMETGRVSKEPVAPLLVGDVVLDVEGCETPNVAAFEQIAQRHGRRGIGWDIPFAIACDPIRVTLRRDGEQKRIRFPLPSPKDALDGVSGRYATFHGVFDTDARLTADLCGGPLVDTEGRVVGITIAVPETIRGDSPVAVRVFVIPAAIACQAAEQASFRPSKR